MSEEFDYLKKQNEELMRRIDIIGNMVYEILQKETEELQERKSTNKMLKKRYLRVKDEEQH